MVESQHSYLKLVRNPSQCNKEGKSKLMEKGFLKLFLCIEHVIINISVDIQGHFPEIRNEMHWGAGEMGGVIQSI